MRKPNKYKNQTRYWPKDVPFLTAEDFVDNGSNFREQDSEGNVCRRCFLGWSRDVFNGNENDRVASSNSNKVSAVLADVLEDKKVWFDDFYDVFTKQECADLWNRTMEEFGYTEDA